MATAENQPLVVIGADRRELEGILARCQDLRLLRWGLDFAAGGRLCGVPVLLLANGPGPRLAAAALRAALSRQAVRGVLSAGTCGGLDPALRSGDVIVAEEIRCGQSGRRFSAWRPRCPDGARFGVLVTVDHVVLDPAEKARWRVQGATAVEMESAALASEGADHGLPVAAVRVVLDTAEQGFRLDFNRVRSPDGRFRRWALVREALRRPRTAGRELWRLRAQLRVAAEQLGAFLAECDF